jgi:glycosyltransferase involved in cell wall biosynthesis
MSELNLMKKLIPNKKPLVSIIINNYNYDKFLKQAIDSALGQTYHPIETIVVDDGSTDSSPEIIYSYGNLIIPILKKNGGQASSLNSGFNMSKGNLIFFLDSDDLFDLEKVEKMVNIFSKNELINLPIVMHNAFEAIDKEGRIVVGNEVDKLKNADWLSEIFINYVSFFNGEINRVCTSDKISDFARKYRYIPYIGMPTSSISISRIMAEKIFPLPVNNQKISADDLLVKASSLIGDVYSTKLALTQYRFHGNNNWYGKKLTLDSEKTSGIERDKYLNLKLQENGKQPIFSFLESMQADGFYRQYFKHNCGDYLISLAFNVLRWHRDLRTIKFFLKTCTKGIMFKFLSFINNFVKTSQQNSNFD